MISNIKYPYPLTQQFLLNSTEICPKELTGQIKLINAHGYVIAALFITTTKGTEVSISKGWLIYYGIATISQGSVVLHIHPLER